MAAAIRTRPFVFQAGSGLTTAGNIVLINGAQAKNVYWHVGSSATIGTASQWQGNIVALHEHHARGQRHAARPRTRAERAVTLGTENVITLP